MNILIVGENPSDFYANNLAQFLTGQGHMVGRCEHYALNLRLQTSRPDATIVCTGIVHDFQPLMVVKKILPTTKVFAWADYSQRNPWFTEAVRRAGGTGIIYTGGPQPLDMPALYLQFIADVSKIPVHS